LTLARLPSEAQSGAVRLEGDTIGQRCPLAHFDGWPLSGYPRRQGHWASV